MPREFKRRNHLSHEIYHSDCMKNSPPSTEAQSVDELKATQPARTRHLRRTQTTEVNQAASTSVPLSGEVAYTGLGKPESMTPPVPETALSKEQSQILDVVKQGGNVFFTGPAGTGKSVLLRAIIKELVKTKPAEAIAITATTGIAALAIGGQTLHSYGGVGTGAEVAEILAKKVRRSHISRERWKRTKIWIIDEVSMLKAELFDKLEYIARFIRKDSRPFGGIQLILAGDFFQLPPVCVKGCARPPDYVFAAQTWKTCIPYPYFLRRVFRQKDNAFVSILSAIRVGCLTQQQTLALKSLERPLLCGVTGVQPAILLSSNKQVKAYNMHQLGLLHGDVKQFSSIDSAGWDVYREPLQSVKAQELLDLTTLAPQTLSLKVGAQVMLIQNVLQGVLVNGSIGKVIEFMTIHEALEQNLPISAPTKNAEGDDDLGLYDGLDYDEDTDFKNPPTQPPQYQHRTYIEERILACYDADPTIAKRPTQLRNITGKAFLPLVEYPLVHFMNGQKLLCVPMFFDRVGLMGNIEARRAQVPLILSWAITIHKSQGQTLNFVKVDFERMFADGQAYVALSRVTSMDGLQVINFQPHKIHANPRVIRWHNHWQDWWKVKHQQQLFEEVVTQLSQAPGDSLIGDCEDVFDFYNTEIPHSWLEEHDLLAEIATDPSWVEDILMSDNDNS